MEVEKRDLRWRDENEMKGRWRGEEKVVSLRVSIVDLFEVGFEILLFLFL